MNERPHTEFIVHIIIFDNGLDSPVTFVTFIYLTLVSHSIEREQNEW